MKCPIPGDGCIGNNSYASMQSPPSAGIEIAFTETDYSFNERNAANTVRLALQGRLATNVTVGVTAMLYDDLVSSGVQLTGEFPEVPPSDPISPNRASGLSVIITSSVPIQ